MGKVTGIGGVFLKAQDPKALSAWYVKCLGLPMSEHGAIVFEGPETAGTTVFSQFPESTKYFGDGPQQYMLNFRVDDIDALLVQLAEQGVKIDPKREDHEYGRFAWIWDPEGNRVELWQP
jgi:predicted enzyme related to lactoylglutathione lyase